MKEPGGVHAGFAMVAYQVLTLEEVRKPPREAVRRAIAGMTK
jgi:hypothetical protein